MKTGRTILKNTTVTLLGRALTILLGILYITALSRHVGAAGMGMIATAAAVVPMASLLINFGLNDVTVRDVSVDKSRAGLYLPNLFLIRGGLILVFAVVIFTTVTVVGYPPETTAIIFIYSFSYLFDELSAICFAIFNAHEKMEFSAGLQTGRDLLNMVLSLTAIAFKADLYLIVGISVLVSLLKLIVSLVIVRRKFALAPKLQIDLSLSRRLLKTTLPFAALLMISVFLQNVDTFILSLFRSTQEVGWYGSANLLINYLLLVPTIFLQSVFPVFARFNATSRDDLKTTYALAFKFLLVLGFAMCFGIWVTADKVVELIYGAGFEPASTALRILSILLLWIFGFANGSLLNATGGQGIATRFAVAGLILAVGLSLFLTPRFGLTGTALARIVPGALFFFPLTWISHRRLDLPLPYGAAFKTLIAALVMSGVSFLALNKHVSLIIVILLIAPLSYGICLVALGVITRSEIGRIAKLFERKKIKNKDDAVIRGEL
ncbi:MAG: hypothetical protein DPW18_03070 [Chloroflexi bacterium]|nr:hypothetical protein [Chloroflexota bacterium]MDL1943043.1 flippase [Chloroflexi bacterium CFX2]